MKNQVFLTKSAHFFSWFYPILFGSILFGVYFYQNIFLLFDGYNFTTILWTLASFIFALILLIFLPKIQNYFSSLSLSKKSINIILAVTLAVFYIIMFSQGSTKIPYDSWDLRILHNAAAGLIENGTINADFNGYEGYRDFIGSISYFPQQVNTVIFLFLEALIPYGITHSMDVEYFTFVFFDCLWLTLSLLVLYLLLAKLFNPTKSLIYLIIFAPIVYIDFAGWFCQLVGYNWAIATFLTTLFIYKSYCFFNLDSPNKNQQRNSQKSSNQFPWSQFIILLIITAFMVWVRPVNMIFVICFVLVLIIFDKKIIWKNLFFTKAIMIVMLLISSQLITQIQNKIVDATNILGQPVSEIQSFETTNNFYHWALIGAGIETSKLGSIEPDDCKPHGRGGWIETNGQGTTAEALAQSQSMYLEGLSEKGITNVCFFYLKPVNFYANNYAIQTNDLTVSQNNYNISQSTLYYDNWWTETTRSVFGNSLSFGKYFWWFIWSFALLGLILSVWFFKAIRDNSRTQILFYLVASSLFCVTMYLIVFEGDWPHLSPYAYLIIIMSILGLEFFYHSKSFKFIQYKLPLLKNSYE